MSTFEAVVHWSLLLDFISKCSSSCQPRYGIGFHFCLLEWLWKMLTGPELLLPMILLLFLNPSLSWEGGLCLDVARVFSLATGCPGECGQLTWTLLTMMFLSWWRKLWLHLVFAKILFWCLRGVCYKILKGVWGQQTIKTVQWLQQRWTKTGVKNFKQSIGLWRGTSQTCAGRWHSTRLCCRGLQVRKGFPGLLLLSGHPNKTNSLYLPDWMHGHQRQNRMNYKWGFIAFVNQDHGRHQKISSAACMRHLHCRHHSKLIKMHAS